MSSIGERIESERIKKGLSKTEIWKGAGLTSGVYSQWMNGQTLNGDSLVKVASILGVDPYWLQTGKQSRHEVNQVQAKYNADSINIHLLAATGSMGNGNENDDADTVIDVLSVNKHWANKTLANITAVSNLAFIHAIGDSMSPTFTNGDILLIDTGIKNVTSDSVYVLEAHNRLFIKRVRGRMDGSFEISSDNPLIKTVDTLNGDHQIQIKGRVVWVWNGRTV